MSEVIRIFDEPVIYSSRTYHARVIGRLAEDRMWEGWMEFVPMGPGDGKTVISAVESRQSTREQLVYWSQGLSPLYAQGSLDRALHPIVRHTRQVEEPASDKPASRTVIGSPLEQKPEAVLNPFDVGSRSMGILSQELRALNRQRLLNIVAAYDLNPRNADLASMKDTEIIGLILGAVEGRLLSR